MLLTRAVAPLGIIGRGWRVQTRWQKQELLTHYGNRLSVHSGPAQDIIMWSGAHEGAEKQRTLGEFLGKFGNSTGAPLDEFALEDHPKSPELHDWHEDWVLPDYFAHYAEGKATEGTKRTLNIGDHGAGLPPHVHGASWLTAVFGAKKWYIWEPGGIAAEAVPDPLSSFGQWERDVLPALGPKAMPMQCLQQAGETLYLPAGWVHATSNIGEGIAIGMQGSYDFKLRTAAAEEGGGMEGANFFVLKDLGIAHKAAAIGTKPHDGVEPSKAEEMFATHQAHISQSSEALQRALELQPDHWMNYVELAELYELSGDHESRAEISVKLVDSVRKSLLREDIPVRCIQPFPNLFCLSAAMLSSLTRGRRSDGDESHRVRNSERDGLLRRQHPRRRHGAPFAAYSLCATSGTLLTQWY